MSESPEKPGLQPKFKPESISVIHSFIKQKVEEAKAKGVVLGLSGGLDSAVVAKLCVDSLGSEKVLVLIMPETTTPEEDIKDALEFASSLSIDYRVIDITEIVESFTSLLSPVSLDSKALGNIKARCRMILLYIHANLDNKIVMGTSNKSELLTGYFTKFGDSGADFAPIGDLYKTQIIELAKAIDIQETIISKPPSAGLAQGQTDENELGIRYKDLDAILLGIELKLDAKEIAKRTGIAENEVARILDLVQKNVHKRKIPLIPKLGIRTLGADWRE
ncbi:MAG: NAD+ synthase [Thermoplasmata archaeon]|nr:MAG: NAD+ synthase [Thermoplasmata archaeon]